MTVEQLRVASPLGPILLEIDGDHLCALVFSDSDEPIPPTRRPSRIASCVEAYFTGELDALDGIRVAPSGTAFQLRVWQALRRIPVGETRSYLQIAVELGAPTATRAVGAANGKNPISLVLPCHRVIGASGALTGYGGGLWRKEWLLRHERALPPGLFDRPAAT